MSLTKANAPYSIKNQPYVDVRTFGAVGDGVTDDTAAIQAADAAAVSAGLPLIISGTPKFTTPMVFTGKSNWIFTGASGTTNTNKPQSYLIKDASCAGAGITFSADAVRLKEFGLVCEAGNTGDGLVLLGNSPYIDSGYITGAGQDGLRLGSDITGSNANSFNIKQVRALYNTRYGFNIHDFTPDANAGVFDNPIATHNGSHGFYGGKASLGVTILAPTFEANTGYGAYFDTLFGSSCANIMVGGDIEANLAGNLYEAVPYQTIIIGTSIQGKAINSMCQMGDYIPVLSGITTTGDGIYTAQDGHYEISGSTVSFSATITWTAHTGTGQLSMNLPIDNYKTSPVNGFSPVNVIGVFASGVSAGAEVVGLLNHSASKVQFYTLNSGVLSAYPVVASGTIYIRGSYPLSLPNYFVV